MRINRYMVLFMVILFIGCSQRIIVAQENEELGFEFQDIRSTVKSKSAPPRISSPAAVAIDTVNGRILYNKNAFSKRQMASTTKMMTAILAIETGNLNDMVTVSKRAAYVGGSQAYLKVGEKIKMADLLYALMLPSGNDAAVAIAEHVAGTIEDFVKMMDEKARSIGAVNTKFGSPHGLDRNNYSTAYDLALIAQYGIANPIFAKIVSTQSKIIPREGMENGKQYYNTNEMLRSYEGADGVKTGFTGPAGRCLVTSATREGWRVISVVLGANSRSSRSNDSRKILDYVFGNYPLVTVLSNEQKVESAKVFKGKKETVSAINKDELALHITDEELTHIEREFIFLKNITAPVSEGQVIGKVIFKLDNHPIGSAWLYAGEDIKFWTPDMNLAKILKQWIGLRKVLQEVSSL